MAPAGSRETGIDLLARRLVRPHHPLPPHGASVRCPLLLLIQAGAI